MTQRNYCFDIEPQWGSHASTLDAALSTIVPGSLVIEHGAGMYSSPVIARYDVRVICIEEAPGWRSWAGWLYGTAQRDMKLLDRAKESIAHLSGAALVFIDGAARERADMLKWALAAKAPIVIAHDTERDTASAYGYQAHLFSVDGYTVTHDGNKPQTTMWRLV